MKDFFKKNTFQIVIGIIGLIGMTYVLRANVNTLIDDNRQLKADVADLKTFKQVQEVRYNYLIDKVDGMDKKLDRLLRR